MRLSGAGVKRFYNPVKLNFTEWGNWEAIILEAVGNRKALLMTVRKLIFWCRPLSSEF